jgi:hypothetical protein
LLIAAWIDPFNKVDVVGRQVIIHFEMDYSVARRNVARGMDHDMLRTERGDGELFAMNDQIG